MLISFVFTCDRCKTEIPQKAIDVPVHHTIDNILNGVSGVAKTDAFGVNMYLCKDCRALKEDTQRQISAMKSTFRVRKKGGDTASS